IHGTVKNRFVGTPTVWVTVFVFFDVESLALFFQLNGNKHIRRPKIIICAVLVAVVFFFNITSGQNSTYINKPTTSTHRRHILTVFILHQNGWNSVFFGYSKVVATVGR